MYHRSTGRQSANFNFQLSNKITLVERIPTQMSYKQLPVYIVKICLLNTTTNAHVFI